MGEYLSKDDILYERDEAENLLPQDLTVPDIKKKDGTSAKIQWLPIPRGKWLRIINLTTQEQDEIIFEEHILKPKITKEEYQNKSRTRFVSAIITAVSAATLDLDIKELKTKNKKEVTEAEEFELKKKSQEEEKE